MNAVGVESMYDRTIHVPALAGLHDFNAAGMWMQQMAGSIAAQMRNVPTSQKRSAIMSKIQSTLKMSPAKAKEAMTACAQPAVKVSSVSVFTDAGARAVAVSGKKAEADARLATARAKKFESEARQLVAKARRMPVSSGQRQLHEQKAAELMVNVVQERVKAQRATVVAAAALTAMKYRDRANKAKTGAQRQQLLEQAQMAVQAAQGAARTPVSVQLPAMTTTAQVIARQATVTANGMPGAINAPAQLPAGMPQIASGRPAFAAPFQQPRTGKLRLPKGANVAPKPTGQSRAVVFGYSGNTVVASLRGIDGLGDWGDVFNTVTDIAKQVVPGHTIVGKYLNGNYAGATADAVKLVGGGISQGLTNMQQQQGNGLSPQQQQVANDIASNSNHVTPPGGTNPFSSLPGWVIPAGLVAAAGTAALLFI